MDNFVSKIRNAIDCNNLLHDEDFVIVTLSGGADSVALLSALVSLGYNCVAAHCNFHLRGEESNRDCRHALSVASDLGVECIVKDFDVATYEREHKVSTEMACRELRYSWFEQLRIGMNAQAIAVAHHRDDNIETFFLNLMRGTGISGLSGMSPQNGHIIRPMLDCSREEIEQYLHAQNLNFVTDSTNAQNDFLRNRLRNIIIPVISDQFPGAKEAIASTISILSKNESIYRQYIDYSIERYQHNNAIDITTLIANEPQAETILFEMIRPLGFNYTHAHDIITAAHLSGKRFYALNNIATLNRGKLLLSVVDNTSACDEYPIDLTNSISYPITLNISSSKYNGEPAKPTAPDTIMLDASVLDGNPRFTLRHWRKGDRIAPFGMKGTKKLSDIFSNAKLSLNEKSQIWLLTRNDEILWIVGLRASCHYPVTYGTSHVITISTDTKP